MRFAWYLLMVSVAVAGVVAAQDEAPRPKVSKDPLTADQIAVYKAVLKDYVRGSDASLNVADKTEALELSGPFSDEDCGKGLKWERSGAPDSVVHQLDRAVTLGAKMVLVDADAQQKKVEENDPQKLMKRAIDGGERVTDKDLDSTLKQAFATGLFTFSEILFDNGHSHAMVQYSFFCGRLCGHGGMLILKKAGQKWKISKRCGTWIS
jgi:hypothetical protein